MPNKIKLFQGQEHVEDLGLNWDSFKWRNHQTDIGRFFNVDPLAEKYYYNSPYDPKKIATSKSAGEAAQNVLSTVDAVSDTKGVVDAAHKKEQKKEEQVKPNQ